MHVGVYNAKKDFIKRTIDIIEQYDHIKDSLPPEKQHEDTLFVNCLMGLLIIAKEEYIKRIPTRVATTDVAGTQIDVTRILITQLSNAIDHYYFELIDQ